MEIKKDLQSRGDRFSDLDHAVNYTEDGTSYDTKAKEVLSYKAFLARILKVCAREFRDIDEKEIMNCIEGIEIEKELVDDGVAPSKITGSNTEDSSAKEGLVRFDIKFNVVVPGQNRGHGEPEIIQLIINIEIQKSDKEKYEMVTRAVYYVSRMISSQKETVFHGMDYSRIRKVYSIWILPSLDEQSAERLGTINRYRITEERLVGNYSENKSDYDKFEIIMLCLEKDKEFGYDSFDDMGSEEEKLLKMLRLLLSDVTPAKIKNGVLGSNFHIGMTSEMEKGVEDMTSLTANLLERGKNEGRIEGEIKGRIAGKIEGAVEALQDADFEKDKVIQRISVKFDFTKEKAAEEVEKYWK